MGFIIYEHHHLRVNLRLIENITNNPININACVDGSGTATASGIIRACGKCSGTASSDCASAAWIARCNSESCARSRRHKCNSPDLEATAPLCMTSVLPRSMAACAARLANCTVRVPSSSISLLGRRSSAARLEATWRCWSRLKGFSGSLAYEENRLPLAALLLYQMLHETRRLAVHALSRFARRCRTGRRILVA